MSESRILVVTRRSQLALAQTHLVIAHLRPHFPGCEFELVTKVTAGDRHLEWSLEMQGGKGLFTSELEAALIAGEARLAVHSLKDLPGEFAGELALAGFLPREDPRDVLAVRTGVDRPASIATGSPRRRMQAAGLFPEAAFREIRGNVETRLRKVAEGLADATLLAAAGLNRLGISEWPGLSFRRFELDEMVPAIGQGAIAVQSRREDVAVFAGFFDEPTRRAVALERALQDGLGAGCNIASGGHCSGRTLRVFHEHAGFRRFELTEAEIDSPRETAARIIAELGIRPREA